MGHPLIQYDVDDRVATITLNRPERLNALGADMREQLLAALERSESDPQVRVVTLTGAGRAFCSGGDVKEMNERRAAGAQIRRDGEVVPLRDRILLKLQTLAKPVIAAVNGVAAGAGMNLALGCDLRIASDKAAFGEVFVKRGLHPDWGGTYLLPRMVGTAKALELILFGDMVSAEEAYRMGLVNRLVPHAEFAEAAHEWAARLAEGPPVALRLAKRGVYRNLQADLASALEYESFAQQIVWSTEDAGEGIRAFVEKRPPLFQGR
ncbi:MAG: enoyl-CoA hydratase [SAR324 cluster bacterium]|nr:enoyl-CoA hydratase [SAR324 cluster bacterium]